jgi:hypothetical protein
MEKAERLRGTIEGMEPQVDAFIQAAQDEKRAKALKEKLGKQLRTELDPMILEAEREDGQSVLTLKLAASDEDRSLQVVYSQKATNINPDKAEELQVGLGGLADEVLQEVTTVTLTGEAAEEYLRLNPERETYDPKVSVRRVFRLCKDFLLRRCMLRRGLDPERTVLLERMGHDHLAKPSMSAK